MMKPRWGAILLLVLALGMSAGCSAGEEGYPLITDPDLIGTEECRPPCWRGLTPRISTKDEAVTRLEELQINDGGHTTLAGDSGSIWGNYEEGKLVVIHIHEGKVLRIGFPVARLKLGSIVNHFGEPDGYYFGGSPVELNLIFMYSNPGMEVSAWQPYGRPISPDMIVTQVGFSYPEDREIIYSVLTDYLSDPPDPPEVYEWRGFGVEP